MSDGATFEPLDVRLGRGAIDLDEVVEVTRMLAVHLDALHGRGEVDGALVPSRIELAVGHAPRLREVREDDRSVRAYTAPEVWGGAPSAAGDQFAMAAILYEALCGGRAFPGDDSAKIRVSMTTGNRVPIAARVPGLVESVDAVFERAFGQEPAARYPSASAFADALVSLLEASRTEPSSALVQKPSTRPPSGRSAARRLDEDDARDAVPIPWLKIMMSMIALAILAAMMAYFGK